MGNANQLMPERRRRTRIFTLRNGAVAAAAILVLFMAVSVISEMRGSTSGRYGRLYGKELAKAPLPPADEIAVRDDASAVSEQTYADPTLLNAAVRQQYLGAEEKTAAPAVAAPPPVPIVTAKPSSAPSAWVGDAGVNVESKDRPAPVLSGGFGKPSQP